MYFTSQNLEFEISKLYSTQDVHKFIYPINHSQI